MENSAVGMLSVVIPTRNTREMTLRCLESLPLDQGLDVVVVDDASEDGTAPAIRRRCPAVRVVRSEDRLGFTAAANRGLRATRGELLLLLNSDTEVLPGALRAVREAFAACPALGIAGARLHYPDGSPQWSGGSAPGLPWCFALASGLPLVLGLLPGYRRLRPPAGHGGGEVDWVTGAAMALRREVWNEVGPLDERFDFYCQDLDFCFRARRAGWRVRILPRFQVLHHHGATIIRDPASRGRHKKLDFLWRDLVRWAHKHRGATGAQRFATTLRWGSRIRILTIDVLSPILPRSARQALNRDKMAHRDALRSLNSPTTDESRPVPPRAP